MAFIESTREAIEARLLAAWVSASPPTLRTPISFEPSGRLVTTTTGTLITAPPHDAPWVRCTVRHGDAQQKDLNSAPRIFHDGWIYLDVFGAKDSGRDPVDVLVDLLLPVFDRAQFSAVRCRASNARELGQDGGWWAAQVTTRFWTQRLGS